MNYSVAENNIAIVKAVANSVEKASSTASEFLEEQPEAELALAVTEVAAQVVDLIAQAFENNQMGSPIPKKIPWNNLLETPMEWYGDDGDVIEMSRTHGTGKLIFAQKNDSYWWKGIVAFPKHDTNKWAELVCLYDAPNVAGSQTEMQMQLTPDLGNTHYISLSKAKFAGVHTNMYLITNWNEADPRYDYYLTWTKD